MLKCIAIKRISAFIEQTAYWKWNQMKYTKKAYTVRIDPELLGKIQSLADSRGQTVTHIFEQALISFLSDSIPIDDKQDMINRIARLEQIVSELITIKRKDS